jgi:hypothetical protein
VKPVKTGIEGIPPLCFPEKEREQTAERSIFGNKKSAPGPEKPMHLMMRQLK